MAATTTPSSSRTSTLLSSLKWWGPR
jgi:hypothetical protein